MRVRRPHRAVRLPALALVAVVAATGLTGCTGSTGAAAPAMAQVRGLLAGQSAAVRTHDRQALDAALAAGKASARFRARQQAAFADLAAVPLGRWSYAHAERIDARDAERAATKRYGRPAVIVRISLQYTLRGVDAVPSTHALWWTFVRQDGHVRIAGDDDLAAAGGSSWRGPWDFGPLRAVRGARSLVLAHPGTSTGALRAIADDVDAAVPAVDAVWGTHWARRVAVLVPGGAAELAADAGSANVGDDVAALAVTDADNDPGAGPGAGGGAGSGAVPGQRLLVRPQALSTLSRVGRRIVVRHEVTHLATAADTSAATPRWIVEGFAEYVANLRTGQPVPVAASELRAQVRAHGVASRLPADSDLGSDGTGTGASAAPAAAYESAWLACRLIAQRAAAAGLVRFYRQAAGPAVTGDPVTQALAHVVHQTPAAFTAAWRRYVRQEVGG